MWEDLIFFRYPGGTVPFFGELLGTSYCDSSYRLARRDSDFTVLEYIVEGSGVLEIGGQRFTPRAGDVYLLPAHSDHRYFSDDRTPWVKHFINAQGTLPTQLIRAYQLESRYLFPATGTLPLFEEMLAVARRPMREDARQEALALQFHRILHRLWQSVEPTVDRDPAARIKALIDRAPGRLYSISELADRMGRSRDYVIKTFAQRYGVTPHVYITRLKIEQARRLLEQTNLSAAELARSLGYQDPAYFAKVFKAKCGVSPKAYRARFTSSDAAGQGEAGEF